MKNSTRKPTLTIGERKLALADSKHPEHRRVKAAVEKELKFISRHIVFDGYPELSAVDEQRISRMHAEMQKAEHAANAVITMIDQRLTFEEMMSLPSITGLAALMLMTKVDEESQKIAISVMNKAFAKRPRPSRAHKDKPQVQKYWNDWQKKPSLYKNEANFIRDMLEKFEVCRSDTLHQWIKNWKKQR